MESDTATVQETTFLSAEQILATKDVDVIVPVYVPEWNGTIGLKVMTGEKVIAYLEGFKDPKFKAAAFVQIFAECAVNGKGEQLFATPAAVRELKKKSAAVFLRLQTKLLELNGMGEKERNWKQLKPLLVEAGVDAAVIEAIRVKWESPEEAAKND